MVKIAVILVLFLTPVAFAATSVKSVVLGEVEKHYKSAQSIRMDVSKNLKLKLLDREKKSKGTIQVKKGGFLKWETEEPNHSLVLSDGKYIWLVDYESGEEDKPNIIKAANPKKSQPHAVVALLLGEGRISDDFKVIKEKTEGEMVNIDLKPRHDSAQINWLKITVDKNKSEIEKLSFEDAVGNITELDFKNIQFDSKIDEKIFKFIPPKGSEITVLR
jgi:outer membrane lipoprotein carrier protein